MPAVLPVRRHTHGPAAQKFRVHKVAGIARIVHQYFVSRFDPGRHGQHQPDIGARIDQQIARRIHLHPEFPFEARGQRLLQIHAADGHDVVRGHPALQQFQRPVHHRLRDGRVRHERVSPAHHRHTAPCHLVRHVSHVGLGHRRKQSSLYRPVKRSQSVFYCHCTLRFGMIFPDLPAAAVPADKPLRLFFYHGRNDDINQLFLTPRKRKDRAPGAVHPYSQQPVPPRTRTVRFL